MITAASLLLLASVAHWLPALPATGPRRSSWRIYGDMLRNHRVLKYLLAYFIFQTGSFTAMTFVATWLTKDFNLTLTSIGVAMIGIGAGNLFGSLTSAVLVRWFTPQRALMIELGGLAVLYGLLAMVTTFWVAEIVLIVIYAFNGFIFPVFMATLQRTADNARSTISSLANAAMYFGETSAGVIGGWLFSRGGFTAIALFAAILIVGAILVYSVRAERTKRMPDPK